MRRIVKAVVDATIVPVVRYVAWKLPARNGFEIRQPIEIAQPLEITQPLEIMQPLEIVQPLRIAQPIEIAQPLRIAPHKVISELLQRAIMSSADYAEVHMRDAMGFPTRTELWHYVFGRRLIPGLIVEFGVWQAESINFFAAMSTERIYGFDSFEGLQEDWKGFRFPKGHFSLGGALPAVAPNVYLIKGWFDATLPGFLASHPEPFSFVHLDSDTYEAASSVFRIAADRFVPGTVVLMDEYFGYTGWKMGEFKAWREFITASGLAYDYVAFGDEAVAVLIRHRGTDEK
jgi:hypothetical protein